MRYSNIEDQKAYKIWMRRSAVVYGTLALFIVATVTTLAVTHAPTAANDLVATANLLAP